MSDPDQDDDYASDDYELESPKRVQEAPSRPQVVQQHQQLHFDNEDAFEDEKSDDGAVTPLPKKKPKTSRDSDTINGRYLMDNTPWSYTISALQVRMLRIPVAESATIRELRVFATLDKHATQSRGSRWKQELQSRGSPLRSTTKKKSRRGSSHGSGRVRSGLIEEVKWVRGDGKLQWTFLMEKFRRLKAYAPRIKAFVYGISEDGVEQAQSENLARQEKDGAILSFGWFFLDLRTPDLPERWLKLQNSPFGGEILISSIFLPMEIPTASKTAAQSDDRMSSKKRLETATLAGNRTAILPTVVSGGGEYLQIGDSNGKDIFVLSIFIQEALNLSKLVETAMGKSPEDPKRTGFWLSYSLFDVVVQTDVFYNLDFAEFSPIRDSFRVKSNVEDLALCIDNMSSITVFMCTENQVIAGVEIPLRPLLSKNLFSGSDRNRRPNETSKIEGRFSFPDFVDAVVTASVAVELVQSEKPNTDIPERSGQDDKKKQITGVGMTSLDSIQRDVRADNATGEDDMFKQEQIWVKVEHVRLKHLALSPFAGEEGISIEVTDGKEKVSDGLGFCAFTKQHAFATSEIVVDDISRETGVRVRCFSSETNRLVAASPEDIGIIQDDEKYPKSVVLPMLSESSQSVGQCTLTYTRGSAAHQMLERELSNGANGERHHYRMCLRLKSVRGIELPGGYSLRCQSPFLKLAIINSDWFNVQNKGEVDTLGFYCMFDLTKDSLQLKEEMQETISIDLMTADEERVGSAIFSLSYLFFSEERFCCSEDACDEIFVTQAETEAHWLEVHTDSELPDTQAGQEAYSHPCRSCSINIPIVSVESASGMTSQGRVGSVHVSAYLEDTGLLSENSAAINTTRPPVPLQEKENSRQEAPRSSPAVEAAPAVEARERSSSMSVVREAEETAPTRGSSVAEISADNLHSDIKNDRSHKNLERQKEVAGFRETLERERSAWKQEQHLQQLQWKRRFAEMEKARMDDLEEEWARREEERSNLLKSAQEEYQGLEQTLRKSLAELETRERRLAVAEAAVMREQEAKRDENESLQRRLKSEQSHTLSLAKKQTEAYERRIALLESQLSEAESRSKQVEADFAEYRQQQRKLPESRLREEIAALKGNVAELEKQKMTKEREFEVAEANIRTIKSQLEHVSNLLMQEKKKQEERAVDELEKLRVKYIAREEKYVLDGDRDELRAIKKQLDDLKGLNLQSVSGKRSSRRHHRSQESLSPQHRHNQWHTQSRQAGITHHSRSVSQRYEYPGSSFHSDHGSGNESVSEVSSFVETGRGATAPSLNRIPKTQPKFSTSENREMNHQESPVAPSNEEEEGEDELGSSGHSYEGQEGTELGRLIRERKLLLASGAYDAQSYLVRELDRLINVTNANAEHRTSVA